VAKLGKWVAKLIERLLATAAVWVRIKTSLKNMYNMADISKGVPNTPKPAKNIQKTFGRAVHFAWF
jgi:hypothetical protein